MDSKFNRRKFIASAGVALITFPELHGLRAQKAPRGIQVNPQLANLKALVFDTFGTTGAVL